MIKKKFLALSLAGVTFFLSTPSFAMTPEDDSTPKSSATKDIKDRLHICKRLYGMDITILLNPPSPEKLNVVKKEITELTRKRSSLSSFQGIDDKNKDELSTLLAALNEQFEIEYQIHTLIGEIPFYQSPYLASDPSNYFNLRQEAVRTTEDRLSVIAVRRKEITERLELLTKSSDE